MQPQQLRYLIALEAAGSLRGAARALDVSQAAISESIKRLEQSTGDALVVISGRRLRLTTAGRDLADRARPVLAAFDDLGRRESAARSFRVAAPDALVSRLLPTALREARITGYDIVAAYSTSAVELLTAGSVDAAILSVGLPHEDIEHHELGTLRMSVFGRVGTFAGHDVRSLPFAAAVDRVHNPATGTRAGDGWPEDAFERDVAFGTTNLESALQICAAGEAVAYIPTITADLWNEQVLAKHRIAPVVPRGSRVNRRLRLTLARRIGGREDPAFWSLHASLRRRITASS